MYFYPQSGSTALHLAALEGNLDVVRILTGAKAHIETQAKVSSVQFFPFHLTEIYEEVAFQ